MSEGAPRNRFPTSEYCVKSTYLHHAFIDFKKKQQKNI